MIFHIINVCLSAYKCNYHSISNVKRKCTHLLRLSPNYKAFCGVRANVFRRERDYIKCEPCVNNGKMICTCMKTHAGLSRYSGYLFENVLTSYKVQGPGDRPHNTDISGTFLSWDMIGESLKIYLWAVFGSVLCAIFFIKSLFDDCHHGFYFTTKGKTSLRVLFS